MAFKLFKAIQALMTAISSFGAACNSILENLNEDFPSEITATHFAKKKIEFLSDRWAKTKCYPFVS